MLCTLLQKEEAIAVALCYSFSQNHSFPGLEVCAHSSIEVSQEDECVCPRCSRNHRIQGPVVQSIVSLTSSLRVISLTVLADSIYNILVFFAEKM